MQSSSSRLHKILDVATMEMKAISPQRAGAPPKPGKWSPKQELGHLIDSAVNNHQRIVRAQLEESPAMPGYDGDRWVELHHYQERDWNELIQIWHGCNFQLAAATEPITEAGWSRTVSVSASAPMTLRFLFDDYLEHMLHHLSHLGVTVDKSQVAVEHKA